MTSTSCWGKARASLWDDFQLARSGGFDRSGQHLDDIARREPLDDREALPGGEAGRQADRGLEPAGAAAALECDRTGWTLLMIATVAPARAAARAAR